RRALTGHVTEEMQRKYSTVGLDEKRDAVAKVIRMFPLASSPSGGSGGGSERVVNAPKRVRPAEEEPWPVEVSRA
ncbi:MAG: hypothetical protein KDD70_19260, partial [Bdellovibrionales bacterium]|nr:hypothetical protein [Bdellovibrionales bacterium]